ncbi:MAG: helix-turn-helix domain-containing protein [Candidatus Tyrphobacter sp.]
MKIDEDVRSIEDRRDDELLSIKTVAWYLRIDRSTVHDLASTGKLPAIRVSKRRLLIQVRDLRAYVAAQRIPRDTPSRSLQRHRKARLAHA